MTELLYASDFNIEDCEAIVESVTAIDNQLTDVILDRTCFYPRGGGQDWDTGLVKNSESTFSVQEVRLDESGTVHHLGTLKKGRLSIGDEVNCVVDHDRRSINTRLHSAAHVIDMAIYQLGLDWVAVKGQHYPTLSAIEYTSSTEVQLSDELKETIEVKTNELVKQGSVNSIKFMPIEEMKKICRYVPPNVPHNKPSRVVVYGKDFGIPCGGTHVKDIHEVGHIRVVKLKQKKGIIRLSYAVGGIN